MFYKALFILVSLLLILKEVDMASMYEQAYNKYLSMMEGGEESSSFTSPLDRPMALGKRDIPNPESQIARIGAANIAIYERFKSVRENNKKLKEASFKKQLEKANADVPPSRPSTLHKDHSKLDEYNTDRANRYFKDLKKEFPNLNKKQLSAIVGNLHHESMGFTAFQELGGKGLGDAQWTATRRKEFLDFTNKNNLDPTTYEGSYAFLIHELKNNRSHGFTDDFMKKFNNSDLSLDQLTKMFERQYLVAGKPDYASRYTDSRIYFERED